MTSKYVDDEAEMSENEGEQSETEEGPAAKRQKKSKKQGRHQISSDEDDEDAPDDEAQIRAEMKGFVVDEEEDEVGGEEGQGKGDDARSVSSSEASGELSDEDLELVAENTGRDRVRGRVEISDDEEEGGDRERVGRKLFDDYSDDRLEERKERRGGKRDTSPTNHYDDDGEASGSEVSDDQFIVHDEADGAPKPRRHKSRKSKINDQFIEDAREVFGVENIEDFYGCDGDEDDDEGEAGGEGEEGAVVVKKPEKVSLLSTIEPAELAKGFFMPYDKKIIAEDCPERFQTRRVPVHQKPIEEHDLELESCWIQQMAFGATSTTLSNQAQASVKYKLSMKMALTDEEGTARIKETIRFIRKDLFEVPFIAFYRKEAIVEVPLPGLWRIYQFDEKWCLLQERKTRLNELYSRVQLYMRNANNDSVPTLRPVREKDTLNVTGIQTMEQLGDVYDHFQLYYGAEMTRVHDWEQMEAPTEVSKFKQSGRTDKYSICMQAGLGEMAALFGLTAEEFAENLTEYGYNEIRLSAEMPAVYAEKYVTEDGVFASTEEVLKGAVFVHAMQISREPTVRKRLREEFRMRLVFSAYPTRKGLSEIDQQHPLYGRHYIYHKPVKTFQDGEYLDYVKAERNGLIETRLYVDTEKAVEIEGNQSASLLDWVAGHYRREEFSATAEEWNRLRREVVQTCLNNILRPIFEKEAHEVLLEEARIYVARMAADKLGKQLAIAPFKPKEKYTDENGDEEEGHSVMVICYSSDRDLSSFAVVVDQDGMVVEHQRLNHFTRRANSRFPEEARMKKEDMNTVKQMVVRRRPHAIFLGAEDYQAFYLWKELDEITAALDNTRETPFRLPVEIIDTEVAKAYMKTKMAEEELPEFPPMLKQAVSLARVIIDPMIEICHLCNMDDDILLLKLHPLQDEVTKADMLWAFQVECINRVNEVGVDINRCLEFPHTAGTLQFVSGLGPRKAFHLLRILKQHDNFLGSRTKLVTTQCRMGPKVFMNAAGFIKIDTDKASERTEDYVEVLDGSRVHPETYEWARKMAVDALEYDEQTDQTGAVDEILASEENKAKLGDLDLDAFAEELARQALGDKRTTLYDIRAELTLRYRDLRIERPSVTNIGEIPEGQDPPLLELLVPDAHLYRTGKVVHGVVLGATYKRPTPEEETAEARLAGQLWECPCCRQSGFTVPEAVRGHIMDGYCPGMITGVRVRLDNGITGWVHCKNISDTYAQRNPLDLLKVGREQMFRVKNFVFDMVRGVKCELSCKSCDLQGEDEKMQAPFFDPIRQARDIEKQKKEKEKLAENANAYRERVITHHSFHNVKYREAESMLESMHQGDVIFRPSSKDQNSLSVTWKVCGGIYQHVNIKEKGKSRIFDLGKELFIGSEKFEDLDEIITRWIHPMADYARNIMSCKYFMDEKAENVEVIESHLHGEKERVRSRIPYVITPSEKYPGQFVLSYMIKNVRHEYINVTPTGIRFRTQLFSGSNAITELVNWFKQYAFQRPPPPTH